MAMTLDSQLIDEYASLIRVEGVRSVSRWTLPNNDVPFDEDAALTTFCDDLDGLFALTSSAINAIGKQKK